VAGEQFRRRIRQGRLDVGGVISEIGGDRKGDAEVDEHSSVLGEVRVDKNIGGFDVTVHDAAIVYVVQGIGDL
jgi:hypothetical protein